VVRIWGDGITQNLLRAPIAMSNKRTRHTFYTALTPVDTVYFDLR
jgi:hypothetical protein